MFVPLSATAVTNKTLFSCCRVKLMAQVLLCFVLATDMFNVLLVPQTPNMFRNESSFLYFLKRTLSFEVTCVLQRTNIVNM